MRKEKEIMTRKNFIQIIKLRSFWKIDKRKGNYALPSGEKLSDYITGIVESQIKIDNLGIMANGDLCTCSGGTWDAKSKNFCDYKLMPAFANSEICSYDEMERRIKKLVLDIIG